MRTLAEVKRKLNQLEETHPHFVDVMRVPLLIERPSPEAMAEMYEGLLRSVRRQMVERGTHKEQAFIEMDAQISAFIDWIYGDEKT